MKKLFLMPGFGEDTFCFNELIPLINNHEFIHVDYRPVLDKFTFPFITVKQFATQLIKFYNIQPNDKIIGHSMGGYFSFQIREIQGNTICMIGSFNDPKKSIAYGSTISKNNAICCFYRFGKKTIFKRLFTQKDKKRKLSKNTIVYNG